jgi:hypothetical protein
MVYNTNVVSNTASKLRKDEKMYGITDLNRYPTVVNRIHQSVYRSDAILKIVVKLLDDGAPPKVISNLIEEMCTRIGDLETSRSVSVKE